jgi:hypothetical protein
MNIHYRNTMFYIYINITSSFYISFSRHVSAHRAILRWVHKRQDLTYHKKTFLSYRSVVLVYLWRGIYNAHYFLTNQMNIKIKTYNN